MSRLSGHGSSTNGRGERGLSLERVGLAGANPRPNGGNTPSSTSFVRRVLAQNTSGVGRIVIESAHDDKEII